MNDRDKGWTVLATGLLAVAVAATDAIYRYLRPSMRPWLLLAGAFLTAIGVAAVLIGRRDRGAHAEPGHGHRASRVAWLLLLPVVVALVFDPGALGSYAVTQQASAGFVDVDFDLSDHLRTHTFGGQTAELQLVEFVWAAFSPGDRRLLAKTPVRLTGFVTHFESNGPMYLARLRMGCCAGDAVASTVELRPPSKRFEDDTWVEATGTFDLRATRASADRESPVLRVSRLRRVAEPAEPYEYLR